MALVWVTSCLGSLFYSFSEEPFPDMHSQLPLMQLHSISSCPIAGHQREEIGTTHSTALLEEAEDYDEITPQPLL